METTWQRILFLWKSPAKILSTSVTCCDNRDWNSHVTPSTNVLLFVLNFGDVYAQKLRFNLDLVSVKLLFYCPDRGNRYKASFFVFTGWWFGMEWRGVSRIQNTHTQCRQTCEWRRYLGQLLCTTLLYANAGLSDDRALSNTYWWVYIIDDELRAVLW